MCTNSCLSRLSLHEGPHHFRPKLRYQFSVGMVRMKDTPSVLVFLLLAKLTAIPGVGSTKSQNRKDGQPVLGRTSSCLNQWSESLDDHGRLGRLLISYGASN